MKVSTVIICISCICCIIQNSKLLWLEFLILNQTRIIAFRYLNVHAQHQYAAELSMQLPHVLKWLNSQCSKACSSELQSALASIAGHTTETLRSPQELPLNLSGSGLENIQHKPQNKAILEHGVREPCRVTMLQILLNGISSSADKKLKAN